MGLGRDTVIPSRSLPGEGGTHPAGERCPGGDGPLEGVGRTPGTADRIRGQGQAVGGEVVCHLLGKGNQ